MPFDNKFIDEMNGMLDHLTDAQGDVLAKRLAAAYMAGWTIEQGGKLTTVQERSIKLMAAGSVGYISEFNEIIGTQIAGHISELMAADVLSKDIAKELIPYIDDIFGPDGKVVINNIGKKRSIIKVAKDGTLSKVDKVITQKYTTNPRAYADMLARTSTHNALEDGRAEARQSKGINFWVFTGPIDERSRPDHAAVVGTVYEYGTTQSDYAREMMSVPNCRHRSIEFFEDPSLDTPESHYQKLKDDAGLKFEKNEWSLPGTQKTKPIKINKAKINKTVTNYENAIKKQSFESCGAVDSNGKLIFTKMGGEDYIKFTPEEAAKFKGTVFTHNHPSSNSFSPQDIQMACKSNMKEVRVITPKGKSYTMVRKDGKNFTQDDWDYKINPSYQRNNEGVRFDFTDKITAGTMSIKDAEKMHYDTVWSWVSKDISGIKYKGD